MKLTVLAAALSACVSLDAAAAAEAGDQSFTPVFAAKTAIGATDALPGTGAGEFDADIGFNWTIDDRTRVVANFEVRDSYTGDRYSDLTSAMGALTGLADGVTGGPVHRLERFWIRREFRVSGPSITFGRLHFEDHFLDNALSSKSAVAFSNEIFSAKPGTAFPKDAMGAVFAAPLNEKMSASLIVGDSSREDEWDVFANGRVFVAAELETRLRLFGSAPGHYRVGLWSRTTDSKPDIGDAGGVSVSVDQPIAAKTVVMARYFKSKGGLRPFDEGASIGVGTGASWWGRSQDQVGLGFGVLWPTAAGRTLQNTAEIYYRWQISKVLAVSPNLQLITDQYDSAPDKQSVYAGLRIRFKQ